MSLKNMLKVLVQRASPLRYLEKASKALFSVPKNRVWSRHYSDHFGFFKKSWQSFPNADLMSPFWWGSSWLFYQFGSHCLPCMTTTTLETICEYPEWRKFFFFFEKYKFSRQTDSSSPISDIYLGNKVCGWRLQKSIQFGFLLGRQSAGVPGTRMP